MRAKGNNKGYSLVELLMTLAIFGVVMIGIAMIMRTTSVSYVNSSSEVAMQTEAQIIANQIEELLVDATGAIDELAVNEWKIPGVDATHYIMYDATNDELLYQKDSNSATGYSLMAEYVSSFDIAGWSTTESDPNRDNKVVVEIQMDKDGYVYEVARNVFFRNAIENTAVYSLPSTSITGDPNATKPYDQIVDVDRYEVVNLAKECEFLSVKTVTDNFDDLYTFTDATPNAGTFEIAKAITSSTPTTSTKMYITTNATANAVTGWSLYADESKGIMITGVVGTNPDGSEQTKTVLLTTSQVSYELDTNDAAADGVVYLSTATGDGGGGYMWVGMKGINIASMVYTCSSSYKYAMVAYDSNGTIGYVKDTDNLPQVKTVGASDLGHGYSNGVSFVLNDCGMQKGLAFKPDPEENGFIIVQNNDALSVDTDTETAMAAGEYRLAIMIHYPGMTNTESHTVIDLALVPHGTNLQYYEGAAKYTMTPEAFGVSFN